MLCAGAGGKENVKEKETTTAKANPSGKGKECNIGPEADNSGVMLSIGVFALHDLRAGEGVVLAWEWDKGTRCTVYLRCSDTRDVPVSFFCFFLFFLFCF